MTSFTKWRFLAVLLAWTLLPAATRANVYVTDVKFNGTRSLITDLAPGNVTINYRLNEPATLGVTVNILSGANLIRALTATNPLPGVVNTVVWDGHDSNGIAVPAGIYVVSLTAAAAGHTRWTQISQDTNPASYAYDPLGVAVNNNSNSLFYGRVFMDNAQLGPNYPAVPGDNVTLLKLNADGTYATDGPDGTGGFPGLLSTGLDDYPPAQKLRVGDDDRLYMNDLYDFTTGFEEVVSFDMLLSTNQVVLNLNNYAQNPFYPVLTAESSIGWFSMDVTGAGTANGLIWLGEWDAGGAGIWNWHLTNGVADPNDSIGNWAVAVGGSLSSAASAGLMVDTNLDIFAGQDLTSPEITSAPCMDFTNWNHGLAFNGQAVTNGGTLWTAGANDSSFLGVYDTTIDSRQQPKYVACALNGGPGANGIRILDAATGAIVLANLDATNQYSATAWDNVGNLYAVSPSAHLLRVFAPRSGSNQATTIALVRVDPHVTSVTAVAGTVTVNFVASTSASASQFVLQSAAALTGPFMTVPGATVTQAGPGVFTVSTAVRGPVRFFLISTVP